MMPKNTINIKEKGETSERCESTKDHILENISDENITSKKIILKNLDEIPE